MTDDFDYWKSFYERHGAPAFPSQFAVFTQSWLRTADAVTLVEFGCGNGRDAQFFWQQGHRVTASDQVVVAALAELDAKSDRFATIQGDVAVTSALVDASWPSESQAVVYSRFFQHTIEDETEKAMLCNLRDTLPAGALLFFEFRLAPDRDAPKTFDAHFRRFPSGDAFSQRLDEVGFEPLYRCEGHGYANFGEEDPYVGRFVVRQPAASIAHEERT